MSTYDHGAIARILWLVFAAPGCAQDACTVSVKRVSPDAAFNRLFTQNGPGWTGADSTYSVQLPDGRVAWLYSDSYIGTVDPRTRLRASALFQAHNSIVVQNRDKSLQTLAGSSAAGPASLFSPPEDGTGDRFWVGDAPSSRSTA